MFARRRIDTIRKMKAIHMSSAIKTGFTLPLSVGIVDHPSFFIEWDKPSGQFKIVDDDHDFCKNGGCKICDDTSCDVYNEITMNKMDKKTSERLETLKADGIAHEYYSSKGNFDNGCKWVCCECDGIKKEISFNSYPQFERHLSKKHVFRK